jgi:WD40 repeat protein
MRALGCSYNAGALGLAVLLFVCSWHLRPLAGETYSESIEQSSALSPIILSKSQLAPPLRTPLAELRFSPDSKYILVQDESTIYLLTREPLSVRFQINAQDLPPARFSSDSQNLIIATRSMGVEWRALPDGKVLGTAVLGSGKPCYDAQLSPHGNLYACIDRDIFLRIFDVPKNQELFGGKIGEVPPSYVVPSSPEESATIPRWRTGLRHLPFLQTSIEFSPDGRFVFATSFHGQSLAVDLIKKTRINVKEYFPPTINERSFEFIAPNRVIVQENDRTDDLAVRSFPEGGPIEKMSYIGRVTLASDPQYAFTNVSESDEINVIDLQSGNAIQKLQGERADILGSQVVRYDRYHDEIILNKNDNPTPAAKLRLPVGSISLMNAAGVTGDLSSLAISVPGDGAVFQTSAGTGIAKVKNLQGAWFDRNESCYAQLRQSNGSVGLEKIDLMSGTVSDFSLPWFAAINQTKERLMFSGSVLISIAAPRWGEGEPMSERTSPGSMLGLRSVNLEEKPQEHMKSAPFPPASVSLLRIVALDLRTGTQLWNRRYNPDVRFQYETEAPVLEDVGKPFADAQGTRFIEAWHANTTTARKAARQASEAVQYQMKTSRISGQDSFFEVIDTLTGTTVGGTLVQLSGGPGSFDRAFSAGDWLILVSGVRRFSVFSLSTGKELLHSFALYAALSGDKGLLGLAEEHGRISLYDLKTAKKTEEFILPENVVYAHFSTDGRRLLVITEYQFVYILDVSK